MKLTQIRNATNRLEYAGTTFLIDPWLAPKHTLSFVDIPGMPYHIPDPVKENQPMPFYDLPLSVEQIMADVDAVRMSYPVSAKLLIRIILIFRLSMVL